MIYKVAKVDNGRTKRSNIIIKDQEEKRGGKVKDNIKDLNCHFKSKLVSFRIDRSRNRNSCLLPRMLLLEWLPLGHGLGGGWGVG